MLKQIVFKYRQCHSQTWCIATEKFLVVQHRIDDNISASDILYPSRPTWPQYSSQAQPGNKAVP